MMFEQILFYSFHVFSHIVLIFSEFNGFGCMHTLPLQKNIVTFGCMYTLAFIKKFAVAASAWSTFFRGRLRILEAATVYGVAKSAPSAGPARPVATRSQAEHGKSCQVAHLTTPRPSPRRPSEPPPHPTTAPSLSSPTRLTPRSKPPRAREVSRGTAPIYEMWRGCVSRGLRKAKAAASASRLFSTSSVSPRLH